MVKLLILAAIAYAAYRAIKSVTGPGPESIPESGKKALGEIDDVMVKDPVCGVYFPKNQCITVKADGQELHFCSKKCRDQYLNAKDTQQSVDQG